MATSAAAPTSIDLASSDRTVMGVLRGEALETLQKHVLPGYLLRHRWYGAKDAGTPSVTLAAGEEVRTDEGPALLATLRVQPPGGAEQRYFLPLMLVWDGAGQGGADPGDPAVLASVRQDGRTGVLIDAFARDAFVRALLAQMAEESGGGNGVTAEAAPAIQRSRTEQSNTSIRIGSSAMLKGLRKLEPGLHPEVEVGRFLTGTAGFANTPALLGTIEQTDASGQPVALCVLQALVPDAEDAWGHVLERAKTTPPDPELLALVGRLGRRTAEMHHALASQTDDPAFQAEQVENGTIGEWVEAVRTMARTTLASLERALPSLSPEVRGDAERLLSRRDELMGRFDALAPKDLEVSRTRLHGDYHLGQVLVSRGDVFIIDFEGEPMRPLAERRAKHSPLRDVAGMLRSFAYAAATAKPDRPEDWTRTVNAAFLDAYREAVKGAPGYPEDPAHADSLLRLFLFEKALYEVGYELANRPDWVAIPLKGVTELLDGVPASPAASATPALDKLAERAGIELEYKNAAGQMVRMSESAKRNMLAALGHDVPDERAASARLEALEQADLGRPLPPVSVVRASRRRIEVPLSFAPSGAQLRWHVSEEGGRRHEGTVKFSDLELLHTGEHAGRAVERRRLAIGLELPPGYHTLAVGGGGMAEATMPLIVTPDRCHLPPEMSQGAGIWGISAQLYLLRSRDDWGIGDFADLRSFVGKSADLGASVIGLNPLHTMFPDNPDHASPYSPASRLYLNILYIDPVKVPDYAGCERCRVLMEAPEFKRRLQAARDADLVDYAEATALKLPVLEVLFQQFKERASAERREAFARFRREQGEPLERLCRFLALRAHFAPDKADWRTWPPEYRKPDGEAVDRFARENADRIDFNAWTQWVADEQLAEAAAEARARGMAVGLYRDLAVGADSSGAETWANPGLVVSSAHVGAPPDLFNPAGQDWGLPPFDPQALRDQAYAGFIDLVRANMRHAGGLRIDHVMALQHLYWIPEGKPASEGVYVSYPLDDMVGILALESQRNRCLVVGEDLGTVPEGFRERMTEAGILSYRVVFFEYAEGGGFVGPEDYPHLALSTVGSHDLATLRGWWEEHDIGLKERHGLYPGADEAGNQRNLRARDKQALLDALKAAGLDLPAGFSVGSDYDDALSEAVHRFLAQTRSGIAMVQIDDLTEEPHQVNLPGTTDQHPNWRRKQSLSLEELTGNPRVVALARIFQDARPLTSSAKEADFK
ncbi:4-alpha-glucanotransferase [Skermanella mucosa]|uniref:4-alpha-glucanotransferase n=1 Tax=Skermanella mucosa TaxID=1789672 RepID=UPI00192B811D|nr:4-alpha-glucanotransferase [Skermanella mucosa]UEM22486.1 4-alpha-glucanotransferase [Skermanella mucosa]